MRTTRSVALLVTLAIVGLSLTVAPVTSGVVASSFTATGPNGAQSASTNASVGTLMQASAADASNGIETELFETAYERADNESKATLVSDRTAELEAKVAALEAERATLEANREQLSEGAYRSQLSRLTVQLAGLERSIERTERRAEAVGVAEARLATLQQDVTMVRQNTSKQAGPGVATVARGVAGNAPSDVPAGPPDERSPDTTQSPGNGHDNRPSETGSSDQSSDRPAATPADSSMDKSNSGSRSATGSGDSRGADASK
ncbi:hypothetical protein [Natrinema sp. HArc-T2]|uniref:hypothetical protein n=1 Tax=Natrinema sp. HArc-T2 TaxID=3242701 RepID=UPI00359D3064